MIVIRLIKGVSVGLEYDDDEDIGFFVNVDLGVFRVTWYKNLEVVE